ncbi:MAG: hypothetical protein WA746_29460, partial [Isosphaeraceae bacterium]
LDHRPFSRMPPRRSIRSRGRERHPVAAPAGDASSNHTFSSLPEPPSFLLTLLLRVSYHSHEAWASSDREWLL